MRRAKRASFDWRLGLLASVAAFVLVAAAHGEGVSMLDGRVMDGKLAKLPSISNKQNNNPKEAPKPKNIYLCEDGLRRYFFPSSQTVRGAPLVTGYFVSPTMLKSMVVAAWSPGMPEKASM